MRGGCGKALPAAILLSKSFSGAVNVSRTSSASQSGAEWMTILYAKIACFVIIFAGGIGAVYKY